MFFLQCPLIKSSLFITFLLLSLLLLPSALCAKSISESKSTSYTGKIIKKSWAKSFQSFCAGGSSYYVLKSDDKEYILASAKDAKFSIQERAEINTMLQKLEGKKAKITGSFIVQHASSDAMCDPYSQCLADEEIVCEWIRVKSVKAIKE